MSKIKIKEPEVKINPSVYESLSFNREVDEWTAISASINLLLAYALPAMADDSALSDKIEATNMQSLMFFKNEIDKSITASLSIIVDE